MSNHARSSFLRGRGHATQLQNCRRQDLGFSLVEVVIAMMLFSFLAIAILPLLVGVTESTVVNRDILRAKAAIQQQLAAYERDYPLDDSVRSGSTAGPGPTKPCADLPVLAAAEQRIDEDLTLRIGKVECPTSFPNTVSVHLEVLNNSGDSLASMHSSFRVTQ